MPDVTRSNKGGFAIKLTKVQKMQGKLNQQFSMRRLPTSFEKLGLIIKDHRRRKNKMQKISVDMANRDIQGYYNRESPADKKANNNEGLAAKK